MNYMSCNIRLKAIMTEIYTACSRFRCMLCYTMTIKGFLRLSDSDLSFAIFKPLAHRNNVATARRKLITSLCPVQTLNQWASDHNKCLTSSPSGPPAAKVYDFYRSDLKEQERRSLTEVSSEQDATMFSKKGFHLISSTLPWWPHTFG